MFVIKNNSPCLCTVEVVARYGYQEVVDHSQEFVSKVISTIMFKLELKAGLKYEVGRAPVSIYIPCLVWNGSTTTSVDKATLMPHTYCEHFDMT